jgi:hypothetical protein
MFDFKERKKFAKNSLETSERILAVNSLLKEYNWFFVHPYMQNFKIGMLWGRHTDGTLTKEYVAEFFTREFYFLDATLSYFDGIFERSVYIKPFTYFIEHSLILFFQKDYGGAINLILPSIEGAFSKYLTEAKGIDLSAKRYEKIKKVMLSLKDDLLEKRLGYLNEQEFNTQQLDYLISQERKELDNWFANMHLFYVENLFAQTGDESEYGVLNRHSIFHALSLNIYHTEENYIKLFNSLIFIGWIFLQVEGQSLLFPSSKEDDTRIYLNRRQHYESLIQKSEALVVHKHSLLKKYPLHNGRDFVRRNEFKKIADGASPHVNAIKMMFYVECKTEKWILNLVAKEVAKKSKNTLTTKKK